MVKGRFVVNPFPELVLSDQDRSGLKDVANAVIMESVARWNVVKAQKYKVDPLRWKLVKHSNDLKMYTERSPSSMSGELIKGHGLPVVMGVGPVEGKLEDLMYGLVSTSLEEMRIKSSYVDDWSGAALLDTVVEPSLDNPFQSLVVKWMEVDLPFASTNLVKNRDYVYIEGTGYVRGGNGERLGYHLIHSVNFPGTPSLPNRIRADMSAVGLWEQTKPNSFDLLGVAVMDPRGDMIKKVAVPTMASSLMACAKYAYCGQMKKLAYMLEKRYQESKQLGAPRKEHVCISCSGPIIGRRLGDFGKSSSTCKLCFGFLCHTCKITKKLSFVDPDLLLSQRKVTFCRACMSKVTSMSSTDVARAQMLSSGKGRSGHSSLQATLSDGSSSGASSD